MSPLVYFAQDFRYALKTMRKQPGFAAAAVLTLALGIGANTAIFSVIYSVLLRPLPFKDSGRFVHMWSNDPAGSMRQSVSYPDFLDWQRESRTLERLSAWTVIDGMPINAGPEAERVEGVGVFGDFFQVLDVQPMLGRALPSASEPREAAVVLSHSFWQRRFNSDPHVVGRSITIYGVSYRVIGVMPEGFQFPIQARPVDLWASFGSLVASD